MEIFIQAVGLVAAAITFICMQFRRHLYIMLFRSLAVSLFILQFALMKAWTGFAMNISSFFVLIVNAIIVYKNKNTLPFTIICLIAVIPIEILSWVNAASLMPLFGMIFFIIACSIKDGNKTKYFFFFASISWLVYDSIYFTLGGILTECFSIVSISISTIRYWREIKKSKTETVDNTEDSQG